MTVSDESVLTSIDETGAGVVAHLVLSGAQAAEWGLVHRAAPADGFERALRDVVANLAGKDRDALARIKHLVRAGLRGPLADGLAMETESTLAHLGGERAGAGIDRFTQEGRP